MYRSKLRETPLSIPRIMSTAQPIAAIAVSATGLLSLDIGGPVACSAAAPCASERVTALRRDQLREDNPHWTITCPHHDWLYKSATFYQNKLEKIFNNLEMIVISTLLKCELCLLTFSSFPSHHPLLFCLFTVFLSMVSIFTSTHIMIWTDMIVTKHSAYYV